MHQYISRHPRASVLILLIAGLALAWLDCAPGLNNDDLQISFLLFNGGAGEMVPFGLYNNIVLGSTIRILAELVPSINWYLFYLLITIIISLGVINEFVLRHRGQAKSGAWTNIFAFLSILLLLYINLTCLSSQQIQYTHTAILAGAGAAMVLFDALCGHAGWRRLSIGFFLCFSMYVLRPETIMAFAFLALSATAAWFCSRKKHSFTAPAVVLASGFLTIFVVCGMSQYAAYRQSPEWDEALTYRKQRVRIQDFPDNSGENKSLALNAVGISPDSFEVFKKFVYVPSMDNAEKIERARDIHISHCKGLFGIQWAAERGLTSPAKETFLEPFRRLILVTPWFPLIFMAGLFTILANKKSARLVVPALLAIGGYIVLLLLSGRCTGRVLYPALFYTTAWILAFIPSDARFGTCKLIRCGVIGAGILCFAVCMRHYGIHLKSPEPQAVDECRKHPENLYLSTTWQTGPVFPSGITDYTRPEVKATNIIPISDGWVFYTPAYRAFLKARGISNPYLLLPQPNTYILITNYDGATPPRILTCINTMYAEATNGRQLRFQHRKTIGSISFWQASER